MNAAEQHWDKVVSDFRQLCLLRRQKKWIDADIILNSDLPRAIANWSAAFQGEPAAKKSRLDAMFQAEQRRLDDAWFATDLMKLRLQEEILPSLCAQVVEQVRSTLADEVRSLIAENSQPALTDQLLSTLTEQVRSTVAREARMIILQELAGEDAPAQPVSDPAPERVAPDRIALDDVSSVIELALAEELIRENKNTLELAVCP